MKCPTIQCDSCYCLLKHNVSRKTSNAIHVLSQWLRRGFLGLCQAMPAHLLTLRTRTEILLSSASMALRAVFLAMRHLRGISKGILWGPIRLAFASMFWCYTLSSVLGMAWCNPLIITALTCLQCPWHAHGYNVLISDLGCIHYPWAHQCTFSRRM